ncbi:MAG: GNAT family N-acetyltransferase [Pseudomonadota bacterium]
MITRPLARLDAAAWHAMMLEGTRTHPAAFLLSHREVAAMDETSIVSSIARGHLIGLFDDGHLAGFAGLHLWQMDRLRHRADIGPFYVAEAKRGSGAADALMDALAGRAVAAGVVWLDLWVAVSNERARAFYRRNGFEEVARRADAVRMDGVSEDDAMMTRRLSRPC